MPCRRLPSGPIRSACSIVLRFWGSWITSAASTGSRVPAARLSTSLAKGSEKHCREQLGKTLAWARSGHRENSEPMQLEQGLSVNMYLEDWSNGYANSRDYVMGLVQGTKHCGIGHYLLPDTLGLMSPAEVTASLDRYARELSGFTHSTFILTTTMAWLPRMSWRR